MSKEKRGNKRLCENCGAKFYDLGKEPAVCPACNTEIVVAKPKTKEPEKPKVVEEEKPKPAETESAKKSDDDEPEFVSLDEAAAEEEEDEDAKLADLGDDDEDIPDSDDEDVFLEDDEDEDGSDVSGIIGGSIDSKDEA